jgi:DNA repair protein RecO (recombination protein O)
VATRTAEAIVLRTYPLKEADLIVSFLTREQGKLRGVAKRARRPKSPFGAGLERMSHVRMSYFQRENRELVNLDSCELIRSPFGLSSDYWAGIALDYIAEATEHLLPPAELNEKFFRLLVVVMEQMYEDPGRVWCAVAYFSLWAVRLSGFLPDLQACQGCGAVLDDAEHPERAWFGRAFPGLACGECRRLTGAGAWELSAASRAMAGEMLHRPVAQFAGIAWGQETAADLRRFLVMQMEEHLERRLITAPLLEGA